MWQITKDRTMEKMTEPEHILEITRLLENANATQNAQERFKTIVLVIPLFFSLLKLLNARVADQQSQIAIFKKKLRKLGIPDE